MLAVDRDGRGVTGAGLGAGRRYRPRVATLGEAEQTVAVQYGFRDRRPAPRRTARTALQPLSTRARSRLGAAEREECRRDGIAQGQVRC
jgi:hypothetical protein